jgi:multicomponent Na+:H+ antiporter subunit B
LKFIHLIATAVTGLLLAVGTVDMPAWGDPDSPPSTHVSPRYIEDSMAETDVPNMVTAVLADYRGYDTLGETTVIFTGALACLLILRGRRKED